MNQTLLSPPTNDVSLKSARETARPFIKLDFNSFLFETATFIERLCDKIHFVLLSEMHFSHSSQSLEKFSGQTTLVAHHLEAFMRQIHDTEYPNSVEATEQLLIEQGTDYTKLKVCAI
jgi:hypothetical protein